jgi:hypothetical protein
VYEGGKPLDLDLFREKIHSLSKRVAKMKDSIHTEEATKTSIIMPFFAALDYDIFNPEEFVPEYTADVGIKKGEKVDYAILQNGIPIILVEAKCIQEKLDKHDSQLFRYFAVSKAKFAILTNGILYRFYTDLDETNKMDSNPFFEFNLLDPKDIHIGELFKFRKALFNVDDILNTASELRYTNEIKKFLSAQWENPSEDFIAFIISDIYQGKRTKQVIEKFSSLVRASLKQFTNELVNDKLKAALATNIEPQGFVSAPAIKEEAVLVEQEADLSVNAPQIVTTPEEIEGYATIKLLLKETVHPDRISFRDNLSYFNVLLDGSIRKWICRLHFNGTNKGIQFNDDEKSYVPIDKIFDLFDFKSKLEETAKRFV